MKALAQEGCNFVPISNEKDILLKQAEEFSEKYNIKIEAHYCDLAQFDQVKELSEQLKSQNICGLINNAGFGLKGHLTTHPVELYRDIIAVNSTAPVVMQHAILPILQEKNRGLVINIASINAYVAIPGNQVYTATKSFAMSFSLAVEGENDKSGIVFQLVLPGTTITPFHDKQGVKPAAGTMYPDKVVKGSLRNLNKSIYIPNRYDRIIPFITSIFSKKQALRIARHQINRRLGLNKKSA